MADLVVTGADLGNASLVDIRISQGRIKAIGPDVEIRPVDRVFDASGSAVLPGLHDHHTHLLAAAAARRSVALGPADVSDPGQFAAALREADLVLPEGSWIRGIGYHDRVAGPLDRHCLDEIVPERPVRIQHRSGSQWILNTRALEALMARTPDHVGIERDASGSPTGRLHRMDHWIDAVAERSSLCLDELGERAARLGVSGFTDATPVTDLRRLDALALAVADQRVRQRTTVMTGPGTGTDCPTGLTLGAVKLMLDDVELPGFDELRQVVAETHRSGRPVAVHCVTRVQLVLTIAALEEAGTVPGDRVEHGAVIPAEVVPTLGRLGVTVVTNPGFLFDRGDDYLADVDPGDQDDLYRCRSLKTAGVGVAAGTDAPFGPDDPWAVARAAASRLSRSGRTIGADERVDAWTALSLFFGSAAAPAIPRTVSPGALGDLCVLFTPLEETLRDLDAQNVAATIVAGEVVASNG